jgi:SAF domain
MTTLLDRAQGLRRTTHADRSFSAEFHMPVKPSRRRPVLAAASAVAVFASIGLFAHLYSSADRETSVLVVTHTIQQGQTFTGADLGQTPVATGSGVATVPLADASQILGKVASVTVVAGSLLTPGDLASAPPISEGDAVVGLALKQGQVPAGGLGPGDQVMVVETGPPGSPLNSSTSPSSSPQQSSSSSGGAVSSSSAASGSAADGSADSSSDAGGQASGVLVPDAMVFNTASPGSQSSAEATELVSLELSDSLAPVVSAAGTAGQVSLVLVPSVDGADSTPATARGGRRPRTSSAKAGPSGTSASTGRPHESTR